MLLRDLKLVPSQRWLVLLASLVLVAACGDSELSDRGGGGSGGSGGSSVSEGGSGGSAGEGGAGGEGGSGGEGGVLGEGGTGGEGGENTGGTGGEEELPNRGVDSGNCDPEAGLDPSEPQPRADPSGATIFVPVGARRGPVVLRAELPGLSGETEVRVELQEDESWQPITTFSTEIEGESVEIVWDSFADFDEDGAATLRFSFQEPEAAVVTTEPFTLELMNDAQTPRLILVSHSSILEGGSAVSKGTSVTAIPWSDAGAGTAKRVEVGVGPDWLSAAPHGRTTAVLNWTSQTISVVSTPLDASLEGIEEIHELYIPHGTPRDIRWSPDGRYLYVIGTYEKSLPATLWRFEPSEGYSCIKIPTALATFPGTGMRMAVDPSSGRLLAAINDFDIPQPFFYLLESDGTEIMNLAVPLDLRGLTGFEVSPTGDYLIATSSFLGDVTYIYRLDGDTIEMQELHTDIRSPTHVFFHPASQPTDTAVLVANSEVNRVTPLLLQGETSQVLPEVSQMHLAAGMDGFQRGSRVGTVFAPVVDTSSKVRQLSFSEVGATTVVGSIIDLGEGAENFPSGIAVQR